MELGLVEFLAFRCRRFKGEQGDAVMSDVDNCKYVVNAGGGSSLYRGEMNMSI